MRKQTKFMAVLSTAAVMAAVTPAFTAPVMAQSAGWVEEDGSFRYFDSDGYYLTDSWKKQDGNWYYLDEEGEVALNRQIDEYYVNDKGQRVSSQWVSVLNEDQWDTPDAPENHWFYYGKSGKMVVSKFQSIEDNWYSFDSDGRMMTGLAEIDGSRYYLGEDGVMRTGWIQLEQESDDPDENTAWYFFENSGKMVENQVDRKISNAYYTFVNGKMQTGWYQLPASETTDATASDATAATADTTKANSAGGYRFYEPESGKRGSGWYTIEGIPGISEEGETYNFYFKNGNPHFASTGIQAFSINSAKYAFNTRGEMQTGLQVITLEDGSIANAYFGTDGVMKTGKQVIYNQDLDENQTWFFHTDGTKRGQGFHGIRDNAIYVYGLRQEAWADLRFAPVTFQDNQYLVNVSGTIQKASTSSKSTAKPELGAGFKDVKDTNGTVWTVDVNGIIK